MEFVLFISMTLFMVFCTAILVFAMAHANDKNEGDQQE